jgi:lipopolysaccharide/colanic/teichoic acid biosynthesis glycosyltransferase
MNITKANTYTIANNEETLSTDLYTFSKRLFDIIIAGTALIVLSPMLLVVALIIRFTSKGDILFCQKRAGLNGRVMNFPKFRSMIQDAEEQKAALLAFSDHDDSITFKMKSDPRITPIGRIIRKLSIDELPQLFLVLKGEMSMVGPRPATFDEVMKYNEYQTKRLSVKPGLTCIWQVSGRATIPFKQQVEMDRKYIDSRSILLDLKLLILTIPAIISTKGAF